MQSRISRYICFCMVRRWPYVAIVLQYRTCSSSVIFAFLLLANTRHHHLRVSRKLLKGCAFVIHQGMKRLIWLDSGYQLPREIKFPLDVKIRMLKVIRDYSSVCGAANTNTKTSGNEFHALTWECETSQ